MWFCLHSIIYFSISHPLIIFHTGNVCLPDDMGFGLFLVLWQEENDVTCENDYRAGPLNLALLFTCPGVNLYFCFLLGVCVCVCVFNQVCASVPSVSIQHSGFCLSCFSKTWASFCYKDDGDYINPVGMTLWSNVIFLTYLKSDSYIYTHTRYRPTHSWQPFNIWFCFVYTRFSLSRGIPSLLISQQWTDLP